MIELLTALPGAPWEGELVARLERAPVAVRVVRRCADLADLLAVAASGLGSAALVSPDLRRLDRDALARLAEARVAVVGVAPTTDLPGRERLELLGLSVLSPDVPPADLAQAVTGAAERIGAAASHAYAEPLRALTSASEPDESAGTREEVASPLTEPGRLVAVWGPVGAPGRTTMAVTLASEAAALGQETLLVDGDPYGGVIAPVLGLLDEAAGLAAAVRIALGSGLDLAALARVAPVIAPSLRLLSGIPRADRWPELRPAALEEVYAVARRLATLTVVDCGFCLEQDEELSFDVAAPRRNGATLATLEQADEVVAVCSGDALGVQRFVRGLRDLQEAVPGASVRVVVNRVRRSAVGGRPETQLAEALQRYAGVTDAVFVPDDRAGVDATLVAGRTLREAAPGSPVRAPVRALAAELAGVPRAGRPRRRLGKKRSA